MKIRSTVLGSLQKTSLCILLLVLVALLGACSPEPAPPQPTVQDQYEVSPQFREFYDRLGGRDILGPPISPVRLEENLHSQFTEAGLMVFDPQTSTPEQIRLFPLGVQMGVQEPPVPEPTQATPNYIGGHYVDPSFQPFFELIGGVEIVGRPLTEIRFNPDKRRYEQYFENLGFFRLESEPLGTVHLLAYGAWSCPANCRSSAPLNSTIVIQTHLESPFKEAVESLGSDFTGFALGQPYLTTDGKVEQVFENVVLMIDFSNPNQVQVKSIHKQLQIFPDPPATPKPENDYWFFETKGGRGYNIPLNFLDYINRHGGLDVSGFPITEASRNGTSLQQCFEKLCLEFKANGLVRPVPLGYSYQFLSQNSVPLPTQTVEPVREVTMQMWVRNEMLASNQEQEVGVILLENNDPLSQLQPQLTITLPDGSRQTFTMPASAPDGRTSLRLPPIDAPNGTLIPFQICIRGSTGERFCMKDDYLIWNQP